MMRVIRLLPVLLMLSALWVTTATYSHFSQDSWSYYELSRHIFDDFYHVNTWRQFHIVSETGVSFPPLWPVLIACVDTVLGIGIYAGFILNFIIAILTFKLLRRLSKLWFGEREWGLLLFAALMMTPDYTTALFSAATLPLGLLLLLLVLYLYASKRYAPPMRVVLLAIVAGLGVLNRFDFVLPALALGLFILPLRLTLLYYTTLLVALLPWIGYSLSHFGVYWMSDNSRTVLSAVPIFVRDYYPDGVPLLWDQPLDWIQKTIGAVLKSADVMFTATSILPWVVGVALLAVKRPALNKNILLFAVLIGVQLASILITGFVETRYYVPLELFLLVALLWLTLPPRTNARIRKLLAAGGVCFAILYSTAYVAKSVAQSAPLSLAFNPINQQPIEFGGLLKCMSGKGPILLPPLNYSYKFGALTGIPSYIEPTNISGQNSRQFLKTFKPKYVLTNRMGQVYGIHLRPICSQHGWGESDATYYLYQL